MPDATRAHLPRIGRPCGLFFAQVPYFQQVSLPVSCRSNAPRLTLHPCSAKASLVAHYILLPLTFIHSLFQLPSPSHCSRFGLTAKLPVLRPAAKVLRSSGDLFPSRLQNLLDSPQFSLRHLSSQPPQSGVSVPQTGLERPQTRLERLLQYNSLNPLRFLILQTSPIICY
jgi:hypothetical protein